jgi:hypothetical protein
MHDVWVYVLFTYMHARTIINKCMYVCVCMYVCMHVCMYVLRKYETWRIWHNLCTVCMLGKGNFFSSRNVCAMN